MNYKKISSAIIVVGLIFIVIGIYTLNKSSRQFEENDLTTSFETPTVLSGYNLDEVLERDDVKQLNITKEKIENPEPVSFSDVNFKIETDKEVYTGIYGAWINVNVTNLGDSKADFQLSLIFPSDEYGNSPKVEKIQEWKNINHPSNIYHENCSFVFGYNETTGKEQDNEVCNPYYETVDNYYYDWKSAKEYLISAPPSKIETKGDLINIGKRETKTFRVYVSWDLGTYGKFDVKGYHSNGETILDPQWLSTGTSWAGTNSSVINDGENLTLDVSTPQEFTGAEDYLNDLYHLETNATDSVASDEDGTVTGGSFISDSKLGSGAWNSTRDTTDKIEFTAGKWNNKNLTIMAWFKPSSNRVTAEHFALFSGDTNDYWLLDYGNTDAPWGVATNCAGTNEGKFALRDRTSTNAICTDNATLNEWVHITIVINDTQGDLYMNGILNASLESTGFGDSSSATGIGIFFDSGVVDKAFDGDIDELAVFNETLSATQIKDYYDDQASSSIPNSGNFTSTGLGDGLKRNWQEIEFRTDLDASGINISLDVRTSSDNSTWGSWTENVTPFNDLGLQAEYLQWKAEFMGDGTNNMRLMYVNITSSTTPNTPTVTLNSSDLLNRTSSDIFAEFNVSDDNNTAVLTYNITWWNDTGILYEILSVSSNNGDLILKELKSGNTSVRDNITSEVKVCNEHSPTCSFDNETITVLSSPPTIPALSQPENFTTYEIDKYEFNWSNSTDTDNDNIFYIIHVDDSVNFDSIDYANVSIPETSNTTSTFIDSSLQDGTYYWRVLATDLETNSSWTPARQFTTNTSDILIFDLDFKNETEGKSVLFEANITYNNLSIANIDATFEYNGTNYSLTETNISDTQKKFVINLTTPLVDVNPTDVDFNYKLNLTFTNQSVYQNNSYSDIHQVSLIELFNCSTENATQQIALNFSYWKENDLSFLGDNNESGEFKATFVRYIDDITTNKTSTFDYTNVTVVSLCISPSYETIQTDAQIEYVADDFDVRNYYFEQASLDNTTQQTKLYLLESSLATGISITVQDENGVALSQYIINVQKYDVGQDNYFTVVMGKTNEDGGDVLFLRGGSTSDADVWYRFIITNKTKTVYVDDTARKVDSNTLEFIISPDTLAEIFRNFRNIDYSLTFNNNTKTFVLTFTDSSGETSNNCLIVNKKTVSQDVEVCNTCLSSASGTLNCEIDNTTGTYTASYISSINPDNLIDNLVVIVDEGIQKLYTSLGNDGLIFAAFLVLFLSLAFAFHPATQIIGLIIGLLISSILTIIHLPLSLLFYFIIGGVYLIVKLRT